ncbi:MAG: hypothetical protein U0470_13280 [Anaerolineae bacterium]
MNDEAIRYGQVEWGREALVVRLDHVRRQVGVVDAPFPDGSDVAR